MSLLGLLCGRLAVVRSAWFVGLFVSLLRGCRSHDVSSLAGAAGRSLLVLSVPVVNSPSGSRCTAWCRMPQRAVWASAQRVGLFPSGGARQPCAVVGWILTEGQLCPFSAPPCELDAPVLKIRPWMISTHSFKCYMKILILLDNVMFLKNIFVEECVLQDANTFFLLALHNFYEYITRVPPY